MIYETATAFECEASLQMQERAARVIPGLSQLLSKRPDMFAPGIWPGYFQRAHGAHVWDLDNNRYLDMSIGGIGACVLGYADPDVDAAVRRALENGVASSLNCPEEVELAELLCERHPWAEMVRFARTGGEATTLAVRIARAATGRDKIAFCGYHGWHDWYLSANLADDAALDGHLLPGLQPTGVPRALKGTTLPFAYNRIDELSRIVSEHGSELAAIIMEPIRSDPPRDGFLDKVHDLAREKGIVLIFDEISSGFRLNTGGAHLKLGVSPDMAVFSKAIGNGYAMAAVIGSRNVMEAAQSSFISSTNWTERIGPSAALATIQKHRRTNAGEHLVALGERVQRGWRDAAQAAGLSVAIGGIPPLSHFAFDDEAGQQMKAYLVKLLLQRGILGSNVFYAMLSHTEEHVEQYVEQISEVFQLVATARADGSLSTELPKGPATSGFKRLT